MCQRAVSSTPCRWLQDLPQKQADEDAIRAACTGLTQSLTTYTLSEAERDVIVQRLVKSMKLGSSFVAFARAWVGEMERFLLPQGSEWRHRR